jgi:hypothetical protein
MLTDTLSEVLSAVRLSGSAFFEVTATSPWVAEAPPAAQIAHEVAPGAQHAIEYHVLTRGSCWIALVGEHASEPVRLHEGDIVVVPHGDPHVVSSAPGMRAEPNLDMRHRSEETPPFALTIGGVGPDARSIRFWIHSRASYGLGVIQVRRTVCSINSSISPRPRWAGRRPAAKVSSTGFPN